MANKKSAAKNESASPVQVGVAPGTEKAVGAAACPFGRAWSSAQIAMRELTWYTIE